MSRPLVIALDFDGTVVESQYPGIGPDIGAVPWLRRLTDGLGARLILWTMRDGAELELAVQWFAQNGLTLWGVQRNPEQGTWTASPKAYADVYVDDAALGAPLVQPLGRRPYVDWSLAGRVLVSLARNER